MSRRDAAGIEPRLHAPEDRGGRGAGAVDPGRRAHLRDHRRRDGRRGRGRDLRRAHPEGGARRSIRRRSPRDAAAAASARSAASPRRSQTSGLDNQKQIQVQVRGPDIDELDAPRRPGARRRRGRCPAPWTSGSRRAARSRSSTSASIAALAGSLGVRVGDVAQALRPAFAGVDAGDWVDPTGKTRDVTVRLAPEAAHARRRPRVAAARRAGRAGPARRRCRSARSPRSGRRSARRASTTSIASASSPCRPTPRAGRSRKSSATSRRSIDALPLPPGYVDHAGRPDRGAERGVHAHLHGARRRRAADVPRARRAVRVVPRSAGDHALAAALAHRRRRRADADRRHAQHHEPHRRDPADGHRREERDPADRLREVGGGEGHAAPRGDHRGRPRAPAADSDDDASR